MDWKKILEQPGQAVVGRVKSWIQNPIGRLPVSCTVRAVEEDFTDVFSSWKFVSKALRFGAGCAVNLEKYRSRTGGNGQVTFLLNEAHPEYADMQQFLSFNPAFNKDIAFHVLEVDDSMETVGNLPGIEDSWEILAWSLYRGENIALDLSRLRPKGTVNRHGLVASGPVSFAGIYIEIARFIWQPSLPQLCAVYSKINEVLRRGGTYRNGAITLFVDYQHPEAKAYLEMPRTQIEWAKRALVVDEGLLQNKLLALVMKSMAEGDLFLAKKRFDNHGQRLYSQVCMEIFLKSTDTCTLHHINLGELAIEQIPQAFEDGMKFLCELHRHSNVESLGVYLPASESKQVGLGVLGLANFLAINGISYKSFVYAFEWVLGFVNSVGATGFLELLHDLTANIDLFEVPIRAVVYLLQGYMGAAKIAKSYGMERAFTIAPTATSSFNYRDAQGYVTAPNIAPPIARNVLRDSQEFGLIEADYHPDCETAAEVGFDIYFRLACCFQRAMNLTGLAHAISFDVWDQQPINEDFIKRWLKSPLWTTYYRTQTLGLDVTDKTRILCDSKEECETCGA